MNRGATARGTRTPTRSTSSSAAAFNVKHTDEPSSSRKPSLPPSRVSLLFGIVVCCLLLVVVAPVLMHLSTEHLRSNSLPHIPSRRAEQAAAEAVEEVPTVITPPLDRTPLVILSTGNGRWNTGVWPGYGDPHPTLNWAAAGVVVDKSSCPHQCEFTHDQTRLAEADAVLMELVNHPKFLGGNTPIPVPWPEKRALSGPANLYLPIVGNFYMEPPTSYPKYTTDEALKEHVDFTVGPDRDTADIPITLVCPWGKSYSEFLRPAPPKAPGHLMAYFNEHGIASPYRSYIQKLTTQLGENFHSYQGGKRPLPAEAQGSLANRLKFMSKYKFALVTEPLLLKDWVEPDWSHTLVAGVVPVYVGAPNIIEFTPGPRSFIDIRDYPHPEDLYQRLMEIDADDNLYATFHAWKSDGLSPQFKGHLDNCVHYAECRICEEVRNRLVRMEQRADAQAEIASLV